MLPSLSSRSWLLPLWGVRLAVFSESKFDDRPRRLGIEWVKALLLLAYRGAVVGGPRHIAYFRWLGLRRRPVLPGYDGVSVARVRAEAGETAIDWAARPFVYVGRFVAKKNLGVLVDGYARYAAAAGTDARRLVLIGSGEEEQALRARIAGHGIAPLVEFPGFLSAEMVSRRLAEGLALVLVSSEEQWGLVVNEALACGLPAIVSAAVGAGDVLVRAGVNGFVVDGHSPQSIAAAMRMLAGDRGLWQDMAGASRARAWLGDAARTADAVAATIDPADRGRIEEFVAEMES